MTLAGGELRLAVLNRRETDFGAPTIEDMRLPLLGMLLIVAGSQVILGSPAQPGRVSGESEDAVTKRARPADSGRQRPAHRIR